MKRHGNLFEVITSWENLCLSAKKAQINKRYRPNVADYHRDLEKNLVRLRERLLSKTYRPGPYREKIICEPKVRKISAAPYEDRIVHHALINVLEPIWEPRFIYDSYACRKVKGTHKALVRIEPWMKTCRYVLKCDIRKYFPSIDHDILKSLVRRKIKCRDTLWLVDLIIDNSNEQEAVEEYFPGDGLFEPFARRRGMPIGNQTSQFFANVYLDPMDHFMKDKMRIKRYVRYCDDFLIFGDDKNELFNVRDEISRFLAGLRLKIHKNKSVIIRCEDGVNFLGFRCFPGYIKLKKGNFFRFRKRMKRKVERYGAGELERENLSQSWQSWKGHSKWGKTRGLRKKLAEELREIYRDGTEQRGPGSSGRLVEQQHEEHAGFQPQQQQSYQHEQQQRFSVCPVL